MDQAIRNRLRSVVTQCRKLLEDSTANELQGRFGIYPSKGKEPKTRGIVVEDDEHMGHLDPEEQEARKALLGHLSILQTGGLQAESALDQFVQETAFTWLNRFVAFKMLEARSLLRETVTRMENSNSFKMWLTEPGNESYLSEYEKGDLPQNGRGEGPRQRAYRKFLLAQCRKLSEEVRALYDPGSLPSRFLPQPRVLRELINVLNDPELAEAWQAGNEETVGWVYQGFNSEELEKAFREVRVSKKKFESGDIPAVTQLFTPRWIVRFLVENTVGRLWLELHPDSQLGGSLAYLVPLDQRQGTKDEGQTTTDQGQPTKSVKEITFLDPACGTMHFGLVAFDLFVAMYREEMKNAGRPGWPKIPPVESEDEIPAAIVAHNIHGIDVDLRAVQLSALTLYLKAKTLNPKARLSESRLACASVYMLDGDNLKDFLAQAKLGPIYQRILSALQARLKDSEQLGSLLRLEEEIRTLIDEEHERFEREGRQLVIPGLGDQLFETEAGRHEFWEILEIQINQAPDHFAREHAGKGTEQAFFAGEATRGLRLLELMAHRYDVVVTNPPYMSGRKMNSKLKSLVAKTYPAGKGDLYAAFVQRCMELAGPIGRVGMLSMHSFMFISSYEKLRSFIRERTCIESMAHTGPALFGVGNPGTLQTSAYVFRREDDPKARQNSVGTYFRLVKEPDSEAKQRRFEEAVANLRAGKNDAIIYLYRQADFDAIPGSPWVYWIRAGLRAVFRKCRPLEKVAPVVFGTKTYDNFRFLRLWWEVGENNISRFHTSWGDFLRCDRDYVPLMKGGSEKRWYGNQQYVLSLTNKGRVFLGWLEEKNDRIRGRDYLFMQGITWSNVCSGRFSARLLPAGWMCSNAGSAIFPSDLHTFLGVTNSNFVIYAMRLIAPTINFSVGALSRLPVPFPTTSSGKLRILVDQAIELAKVDSQEGETTWDFIGPPDWPDGILKVNERNARLTKIKQEIDEEVYRLYGISEEDRCAIEAELAERNTISEDEEAEETEREGSEETEPVQSAWSRTDLVKAWISYALGLVMGQFQPGVENGLGRGRFDRKTAERLASLVDRDGVLVADLANPDDLGNKVFAVLELMFGEAGAAQLISEAVGSDGDPLPLLRDYLTHKFFKEHVQEYCKRPIYWYLRSAANSHNI